MPILEPDEQFYFNAYSVLSSAGYTDISVFCKDNYMNETEREDLIRIINVLRNHQWELNNASSRTRT